MLDTSTEPSIGANNQLDLTISTVVVQAPQALKTPTMEEVIAIMNAQNMGVNRTHRRVSRTDIDGNTPSPSSSGISAEGSCPSPTPPYGCIWKGIIENIRQTTTPTFQ